MTASSFGIAVSHDTFKRTKKLKETVLNVGENAQRTIRVVTKTMKEMQHLLQPYDPDTSNRLNLTNDQLVKSSRTIRHFVQKKGHLIDLALSTLYIAHLATASINLVLLVSGLVLLLLHWHPGLIILIFICWILTTLCWVLTGLDYFLHTFAEDTCKAVDYYEQNPNNNRLGLIIPCMDPSYGDKILGGIGSSVHNFITELNTKVTELYDMLSLVEEGIDASGFFKICDPFSGPPNYSYITEKCPMDTVPVGDLPKILERFTCYEANSTKSCKTSGKYLPEAYFIMARSYSDSIQDLIDVFPNLQILANCSFVKDAFYDIVAHQCRPFRVSIRLLWSSMLSLSIFMVSLVLIWIIKAYQDRGKSFSTCSIFPNNPRHV